MKINKCSIRKNDRVKIIAGKDKGKVSNVLKVVKKKEQLIVKNVNMVKKHTKSDGQKNQGGIIEKESPIDVSNVMIVCSRCVSPTRIRIKYFEDNSKKRICKKCNEVVDNN